MSVQRIAAIAGITTAAAVLVWVMFVGLPRWYGPPPAPRTAAAPAPPVRGEEEEGRKIKARLLYVSDDGVHLTTVEREVPYAQETADQARQIIDAQLAPVTEPLVTAIPAATTLRALFVTAQGEAFVDLSGEVASAHPGGSTDEFLTIFTVVNALTLNLPAITAVQLLVDGKEVDTLAGHVDLRRPIAKNLAWLAEPVPAATRPAGQEPAPPNQERGTDAIR
jgi:spore germination protein GerM